MPSVKELKAKKAASKNGQPRMTNNEADLVWNAVQSRQQLLQKLLDPRRDIDTECGYPKQITAEQYKVLYDREGIGTRVVQLLPQESWADDPKIEQGDGEEESEFEKAWSALEKKHNIWHYLQRIDELSGIGCYGVILIGIDDGKPLNEPVEAINEKGEKVGNAQHQIIYLRCFDQSNVEIRTYEKDETNPRYMEPLTYTLTFLDENGNKESSKEVHWSRVIHVADNRKSSETLGVPRMQAVYNRLYDLRKLLGGSAEMFWKGAFPGISLEVNPDFMAESFDKKAIREEMENYMNGLQRYLGMLGVSAKSLAPQVADPEGHITIQIKVICIALGCPYRVFMGTEEAKLAGAQDTMAWNKRLNRRQDKYLTPMLVRPFIDRLIIFGVLPEVSEEDTYEVVWPDLNEPSDKDKVDKAAKIAELLAKYLGGSVDTIIPPFEFLTMFLEIDPDKAQEVLDAAMQRVEDEVDRLAEQGLGPDGQPLDQEEDEDDDDDEEQDEDEDT